MSPRIYLLDLSASRSLLSLIVIVSCLTIIGILALKSYAKGSDEDPSIPLYTPETVAAGNYKKRWSYDNPNTLREAYRKVRHRLWVLGSFTKSLTIA